MMTPDVSLIIEIMLFSEGFTTSKMLAKRMSTMYYLMVQQLSKQDHYDFGLRSVKSVLNSAGALKRSDLDSAEEVILLRSIRDMNLPKFIAIETEFDAAGLQRVPSIIRKCIQCYEFKLTRHGNMLVKLLGKGGVRCCRAMAALQGGRQADDARPSSGQRSSSTKPSPANLYGEYDLQTFEWTDGVLAKVMREMRHEKPREVAARPRRHALDRVDEHRPRQQAAHAHQRRAHRDAAAGLCSRSRTWPRRPRLSARGLRRRTEMGWQPYVARGSPPDADMGESPRGSTRRCPCWPSEQQLSRSPRWASCNLCTMFDDLATKANGSTRRRRQLPAGRDVVFILRVDHRRP